MKTPVKIFGQTIMMDWPDRPEIYVPLPKVNTSFLVEDGNIATNEMSAIRLVFRQENGQYKLIGWE